MITVYEEAFGGTSCVRLDNGLLSVWLTKEFGPRVIGCALEGGENLLVVLPEASIPVKGGTDYSLRGGHRLWVAPEMPETTYLPDDQPPRITEIENGLTCIQALDEPTGIQKSWRLTLDADTAGLRIVHRLTNRGKQIVEVAPWAVTMLRPGGIGLLPLPTEKADEHGLWPNRQLVFWPYTDLTSPHLAITNRSLVIRAELSSGALKIGAPNPAGWVAYRQYGVTFVKKTSYQEAAAYPDLGASHQIYCGPDVIELETLGPLVNLAPDEHTDHLETWELYSSGNVPAEIQDEFRNL